MKKLKASIVLVLALTCLFAVNVMAAGTLSLGLSANKNELEIGDTVTVTIAVNSNPGIISNATDLSYDSDVFEVVSKSVGSVLPNATTRDVSEDQGGTVKFALGNDTVTSNYTGTGTLATVVLKVKDNASSQSTEISVSSENFDVDMEEVASSGDSLNITINGICDHDLVKTDAHAATCTEAGNTAYWTCSICHKIFSDAEGTNEISLDDTVIPALGHEWDEGDITTEPTCTEPGVRTFHCLHEGCNETKTEEIAALGHDWDDGEVTTEPACTQPGVRTYHCQHTGCSETETEEIPALGHDWDDGEVTTAPTCTQLGVKTYHCQHTGCAETKTEEIPANGHEWDEGEIIENASLDDEGRIVPGTILYHCTNCQETKQENFNGLENLEFGEVTNTEAKTKLANTLASQDGFSSTDVKFYEITLMISLDNGATWLVVTPDMMPAEGIKISIPYPEGTDKVNYDFTVLHFLANGNVENLEGAETTKGIEVTVHSLSPFAVGYKKVVKPADDTKKDENKSDSSSDSHHSSHSSSSKKESSDTTTEEAATTVVQTQVEDATEQTTDQTAVSDDAAVQDTTADDSEDSSLAPKTGDSSFVALWIMLLGLGFAIAAGSLYVMKKRSSK